MTLPAFSPSGSPEQSSPFRWSLDFDETRKTLSGVKVSKFRDHIENQFSFKGDGTLADGVSLTLQGETLDVMRPMGDDMAAFWIGNPDEWKRGSISDTRAQLGLLDDRVRFTTRHSVSRYMDSGMEREESGSALVQRVEADLWKSEDLSLGLFGAYARTDADYYFLEDMIEKKTKRKNDGPFADPGRETADFGGTLGLGPLGLTLANVSERAFAGKKEGRRDTGYLAEIKLDVNSLVNSASHDFGKGAGSVLPDSVWASYETRDVDVPGDGRSFGDKSDEYTVGAWWGWDAGNLTVSYWRASYDNRRDGFEDADWEGDGLDISLGYGGSRWWLDAGWSSDSSSSFGEWSSSDNGQSGWIAFSLRPEEWPDITTSFSLGLSDGDYPSGGYASDDWELTAGLDFSKFLANPIGYDSSLEMVFQLERGRYRNSWQGDSESQRGTDFFVGLRYELVPKR